MEETPKGSGTSSYPKVFISYSHDTSEHVDRVLKLSNRLRSDGVDCVLDQYEVSPPEGFPRWMDRNIFDADFVLVVCSPTYYRRVMGEEAPGKGLGVRWESNLIYQHIYNAGTLNVRFIPVLFDGAIVSDIPFPLQGAKYYRPDTEEGYEDLYRHLTNQPRISKPKLGNQRVLPPRHGRREKAGSFVSTPRIMRLKRSESAQREAKLRALLSDHRGFMHDRLESFVGRYRELRDLRQRIAEQLQTGGYVTITGQAGQGKSSIIAKLVEEYGIENTAFHFIPLNPGPDHQVGLLRNLMARLILKYDLSDLYIASENRAALKEYFPNLLKELAAFGAQEVIFIDGLDQLEEDLLGIRDLSFLPTNPPPGIVFVLGTRPNDTLKPLELLKPREEYRLPGLSREDFDLILSHRNVTLEENLADTFYQAMQENALYLDLVAKELREKGAISPREMIARITHNPENIFSVSMARLRRQPIEWREVLRPLLGVLLVAREPLSLWQIRNILKLEDDRLREAVTRLGGLVVETGHPEQRCYSLFHSKLRDFLREDAEYPQKEYIFAVDEEERWHAVFTEWCEGKHLPLIWQASKETGEQARREYARRHYVTHLYFAKLWQQLFTVLDEGTYGQAKERHDLSMRSYIQDLDLGRRAATWNGWSFEDAVQLLPNLWRYTLLRCSIRSRATHYSLDTFQMLLLLNHEQQVVGLAELLPDPLKKVQVLLQIAQHLFKATRQSESIPMFFRACESARSIESSFNRVEALSAIAVALTETQQHEQAVKLWAEAEAAARSIESSFNRVEALSAIAVTLIETQQYERAERLWTEAEAVARSIEGSIEGGFALRGVVAALAKAQRWKEAKAITQSIEESDAQDYAMSEIAAALAKAQRWRQAVSTARSISLGDAQDDALSAIAVALAKAQRWKQAVSIARSIDSISVRAEALSGIAVTLTEAQQHEQVERVWDEVETLVRSINQSHRDFVLKKVAAALAKAQRWEEAEAAACSIEERNYRAESLSAIAVALCKAQRWEQAKVICTETEKILRLLEDSEPRANALAKVAAALAKAQRWEEAEAAACSIEALARRTETLSAIAAALTEAQLHEQAVKVWTEAEAVARSIGGNYPQTRALSMIALALTEAQLHERAEKVWAEAETSARSIKESDFRDLALKEMVTALTGAQRWEQAERVARSIKESFQRAGALMKVAAALTEARQHEQAVRVWAQTEAVARSTKEDFRREMALEGVAGGLAKAQRWDQAERVARSIKESFQRAGALKEVAVALAKAQEWEQAERVARSIEMLHRRAEALNGLAVALTEAQLHEQAERLWTEAEAVARSINESSLRNFALREIAEGLAKTQRWEQAERVARFIKESFSRELAFQVAATALAKAQQWEQAERVARSIKEGSLQAHALASVATALAKAQQWEQAERVARSIEEWDQRDSALKEVATALAKAQLWEQAEVISHSIEQISIQVETFSEVAENLLETREHELLLGLVQRVLLLAETREFALGLLPLPLRLLLFKSELILELAKAFNWVDCFLIGDT